MANGRTCDHSLLVIGASGGGVGGLVTAAKERPADLREAYRSEEESAVLARRLAHCAQDTRSPRSADRFTVRAQEYETRAQTARQVLGNSSGLPEPGRPDG